MGRCTLLLDSAEPWNRAVTVVFIHSVRPRSLSTCYAQGSSLDAFLKKTPLGTPASPSGGGISTVPVPRMRRPPWTPAVAIPRTGPGGQTAKACCAKCRRASLIPSAATGGRGLRGAWLWRFRGGSHLSRCSRVSLTHCITGELPVIFTIVWIISI